MMRETGVSGQSQRMQSYLELHFECHPLMVGVIAGLVNAYVRAPGNFNRWLDDLKGAGAVDLTKLFGLVAKQDHILKVAYEALELDARKLLGVLAFFSQSVTGEVLVELNPRRSARPVEVRKPSPIDERDDFELELLSRRLAEEKSPDAKIEIERLITARRAELNDHFERQSLAHRQYQIALERWQTSDDLRAADAWLGKAAIDLQRRGLIITDRQTARYDLHPMVRGFVRHALTDDDSANTGRAVANYAQSRSVTPFENASCLADLADGIQIVTALTLGQHYGDAAEALEFGLEDALFRLELVTEWQTLLLPFFSQGWNGGPDRAPKSS